MQDELIPTPLHYAAPDNAQRCSASLYATHLHGSNYGFFARENIDLSLLIMLAFGDGGGAAGLAGGPAAG